MMPDAPPSRWLPMIVLAAAVVLGLLAWRLFPAAEAWIAQRDCVASGHTNCG